MTPYFDPGRVGPGRRGLIDSSKRKELGIWKGGFQMGTTSSSSTPKSQPNPNFSPSEISMAEEEDPFAFLLPSCHIPPSQVTTLRNSPFFLESVHFHDSHPPCPHLASSSATQQQPAPAPAAGTSQNVEEEEEEEEEGEGSLPVPQLAECSLNQEDSVPEQEETDYILISSDCSSSDIEEVEEEGLEVSTEEEPPSDGEENRSEVRTGEILKEQLCSRVKVSENVVEKVQRLKEVMYSQEGVMDTQEEDNSRNARDCEKEELRGGGRSNADAPAVRGVIGDRGKRILPATLTSDWMWGVNKMGRKTDRGTVNARNKEVEIVEIG